MVSVGDNSAAALTDLLPSDDEVFRHLDQFQQRAQSCSFPHVPDEVTKKEVERFLADRRNNATKAPDMLALIFAALAVGIQIGVDGHDGRQWLEASTPGLHNKGEAWRKISSFIPHRT